MAKLNAVILPNKVTKENKHKIRISVAHNGVTKYIVTGIEIEANDTFKNGKLVKGNNSAIINAKIRKQLTKFQDIIDNIDYIESLSCDDVISLLKNGGNSSNPSFEDCYNLMIQTLRVKPTSLEIYKLYWKMLDKYIDKERKIALLSNIDILTLETKLKNEGMSKTTIANYMGFLKRLTNFAVNNDLIGFRRNPWSNYKKPKPEIREAWLSTVKFKELRDSELSSKTQKRARDLFLLSFYMGGINLVDIAHMNFSEILKTNKVRYKRHKAESLQSGTHFIEYTLQPETKDIIIRLQDWKCFTRINPKNYRSINARVNVYYKMIAKDLGIDRLIYYSARKTFSQIAFQLGISTYVIDYILGHSVRKSDSCLYHYVYVTPEMATDAIRKVLDFIK